MPSSLGRVVVAGGTGFRGANLARHLQTLGYEVVVLGRSQPVQPVGTFVQWHGHSLGDEATQEFLATDAESRERISRVTRLIEGFETPYGLELLATVHWLCSKGDDPRVGVARVMDGVRAWNRRKGDLFTEHHVAVSLERLQEDGWLPASRF